MAALAEPPGSFQNAVTAIYGDNAAVLWVGTYGGGLFAFDPKNETYRNYVHNPRDPGSLSSNIISSIYCDRRGVTWVGTTEEGLNRFDSHNHTFTRFTHDPDKKGTLSHNSISIIYEDRFGFLWIGTGSGLDKLAPRSGKCERFFPFKSIPKTGIYIVTAIREDRSGILWAGTESGLFRFNPVTRQFTQYTKKEGLPGNSICGLLVDQAGRLWISTTDGLAKFNPRTGEFKNYDFRDGLQHNDFTAGAAYKCRSGQLCFGGINGFNLFFPEDLKDNPYPPAVEITSFKKFNKEAKLSKVISECDEIKLSHKDYFFSFEFTALDFQAPEKNSYAYKIEGFDKEWITTDAKNRVAPYTNLPPGEYVFRVKGSNNSGLWNEDGASVRVVMVPLPAMYMP